MSPELRTAVCRDVVDVDEIIRILEERGIVNEVSTVVWLDTMYGRQYSRTASCNSKCGKEIADERGGKETVHVESHGV
jgi:hypothetical protein